LNNKNALINKINLLIIIIINLNGVHTKKPGEGRRKDKINGQRN